MTRPGLPGQYLTIAPAAGARLGRLVDLGFDDAILVPRPLTEAHLTAMRALLPR